MRELIDQIVWRDHILTLIQLGGSILLLVFVLFYYFDEMDQLSYAQADLDARIYANDEAEASSYILKEFLEDYRALQIRGYAGAPRRLQWIETLRKIGEDNEIPDIGFTLEGSELIQQNIDPYWHPEVPIRATNMKITMLLSHEGDLYKILQGLQDEAPGLFNVQSCNLRWLKDLNEDIALTRLRGSCELRWYTVGDVTENWQDASL
ncbi:MAG: bisphosphoglycerate-dependent phosphoglycerate mutase [Candidatus Azotimanducaceae bacterium]|jgi:bisphosphoglycerate-dependent phosphoglycerate mutase